MPEHFQHQVDCQYVSENLVAYEHRSLPIDPHQAVKAHIETCNACAQRRDEWRQMEAMLRAEGMAYQPILSPETQKRIQRNVYRGMRWRTMLMQWNLFHAVSLASFLLLGFAGYYYLANIYPNTIPPQIVFVEETPVSNIQLAVQRAMSSDAKQDILDEELLLAAAEGNPRQVFDLITDGANIEAKDEEGRTPLMKAIARAHYPVVELLINQGADVNARARTEGTPLNKAYEISLYHGTDYFRLLLENGADPHLPALGNVSMWSLIIANGKTDLIQVAIESGADVNAGAFFDRTPLMLAAANGKADVVQQLLDTGANLAIKTREGKTAYDIALESEYYDIASMLAEDNFIARRAAPRLPNRP